MKARKIILVSIIVTFLVSGGIGQEKLSFIQEEVSFKVGNIVLAGTLSLPSEDGPHPALILITGGSNRNRDDQVGRFKPFKLIAEYLAPKGIAVLRFDDRGVGKSEGENSRNSTLEDFRDDVLAAIDFLKGRDDIDHSKIGLMGHCAGAIAGLMTAQESKDVHFVVSMAGYGRNGEETLYMAKMRGLQAMKVSEKEMNERLELEKLVYKTMRKNQGWKELKDTLKNYMQTKFNTFPEEKRNRYKDFERYFSRTSEGYFLDLAQTTYYQHVLDFDPLPLWQNTTLPMLVLLGERDMAVHPEDHEAIITNALKMAGNKDFAVKVVPEADHYFVKDWSILKFAPGFLEAIGDWLLKITE